MSGGQWTRGGILSVTVIVKVPWVRLPEGAKVFEAYYDSKKEWPEASLERRRALFGG